ncbi:hypothetical protein KBC04_01230 [Candidatus Babeliales bacterium]|nr:hypothetical protein [Candidatus Babeliales bacterium]MBP9843651.1 hypothetical protein [Candidatus Babeliales bacterium]
MKQLMLTFLLILLSSTLYADLIPRENTPLIIFDRSSRTVQAAPRTFTIQRNHTPENQVRQNEREGCLKTIQQDSYFCCSQLKQCQRPRLRPGINQKDREDSEKCYIQGTICLASCLISSLLMGGYPCH